MRYLLIGGTFAVLLISIGFIVFREVPTSDDGTMAPVSLPQQLMERVERMMGKKTVILYARDVEGAHPAYQFASVVPVDWKAEAVAGTQAINIYDPDTVGSDSLAQSQIFIRFFEASDFLTLSTVTIFNRRELVVAGRPAVEYDIAKKAGVAPFASQPVWRSERHLVTDVRVSDSERSIFYVIAKRPDLDPDVYTAFLDELQVVAEPVDTVSGLVEPIAEFKERITKKPFGIYITPESSPVQPDKFTGYHTAVDVEYEDAAGEVPVIAMADGQVVAAHQASGYGGVVVVQHEIDGEIIQSLYGHLDPTNLPDVGATVTAGQLLGVLGEGHTTETDGERMHLHFGIIKGSRDDIRGYVLDKDELSGWYDPVTYIR